VLFEASNSHVSVAASLMALFLTWVVLLAISMIGRKKRAKAGDRLSRVRRLVLPRAR
jgi:hypothetical protein